VRSKADEMAGQLNLAAHGTKTKKQGKIKTKTE